MKKALVTTLAILTIAGSAIAAGPGSSRGRGGAPDEGVRGGGNLIVAANGNVVVTRTVSDSATGSATTQLVAITPSGATAWTVTLQDRGHFVLSGNNLLTVRDATETAGSPRTTIAAISTATGANAWSVTLNGRVMDLEPFSGGTYAVVIAPPAAAGGNATRSLVAISNSGATLWTVAL